MAHDRGDCTDGNRCRYCAASIPNTLLFCLPPAKCREASRGKRTAVADVVASQERPSLLDREPIVNDPDQLDLF